MCKFHTFQTMKINRITDFTLILPHYKKIFHLKWILKITLFRIELMPAIKKK